MRKYYVIVGGKSENNQWRKKKESNKQRENEKKGENDLIYKIFHQNAEEMQITKQVSDQKSKLVFRSI